MLLQCNDGFAKVNHFVGCESHFGLFGRNEFVVVSLLYLFNEAFFIALEYITIGLWLYNLHITPEEFLNFIFFLFYFLLIFIQVFLYRQ